MRRWATIVLCLAIAACGRCAAVDGGDFILADPLGDDYGPGGYIYPKNHAFAPYRGLFDLRSFAVQSVNRAVRFDLAFADLRNTWQAPEGFSHQQIEIYISRGGGEGRTDTLKPGAYVAFTPQYPWDAMLKLAPWESSELILLGGGGQPEQRQLQVGTAGNETIRAVVPSTVLGVPDANWRYYVLVGSYDGFGEDGFRPVMAKTGEWHFGGGRDDALDPQAIDILAPAHGRYSQAR